MASGARPFSHEGFHSRVAAIRAIFPITGAAENIAADSRTGPDLARVVVEGWIDSPGHLKNIQDTFDVTGVGAASASNGVVYFTQVFIERR